MLYEHLFTDHLIGLFTICQGLVKSYNALLAMRFFVGLFEGTLTPGTVYLLAAYYPRFQLQWRINVLMVSTALASAFGGLLAFAIAGMSGTGGYSGWRWYCLDVYNVAGHAADLK